MKKIILLGLGLCFHFSYAQKKTTAPPQKKPLTHDVYDGWKEIAYKALTPDGSHAAFAISPQDGDGKVVFYNLKTNAQDSVKRADNVVLTFDSRFAVFKIKPQQKVVKELRRQKKKKEDLPKDSLGIHSFATRKTEKIADVKSFKAPEKNGGWLAYLKEVAKEEKPKADAAKSTRKVKKNSDDNGHTLVLRSLTDQKETTFGFVKDYSFARYGQGLLFHSTGNDSTLKAGVYWYDLQAQQLKPLHEGKSKFKYKGLSISEDGKQVAFLLDNDTTKALVRHVKLFHWKQGEEVARFLDAEHSLTLPMNWLVSEHYTPVFSKDGNKLFFGSMPTPAVQDTTLLTEEIVQVEVWGGNDPLIYPQQNKQLDAEKKRSYLVTLDLNEKKITQLGSREIPDVQWGDEGNASVVLGETNVPYRKIITWDASAYNDAYLFDLKGQHQKMVAQKVKGQFMFSPKAAYVYWFNALDTAWFTYSVATEQTTRLGGPTHPSWADEENDVPDFPTAYGSPGWTKNDEAILVYDRYDIWSFDPQNKRAPVNLTKIGRAEKTVFRYLKLDEEARYIDADQELLLSAFNETTRVAGFYKLSLKDGKVTKLMMDRYRFGGAVKAKSSNQLLFTRQSFREFPDLWASDINLTAPRKISDANPQMANYLWGSVELVNWTSLDNIPLQGLLYKPEGFDPKKKYPLIVNFYERSSENLHAHNAPFPHRSTINQTVYTSNGYLIFIPDVVYRVGFPGESAKNCILPGVTSLVAQGFVDEKNIGIQGHSWGGYQIAYLLTRTNMFKAAEAGAIVANMISAYGGIRWESGLARMFQYEHAQSRIGGSLWEKPMHFIENSPIFFADKIQTPLLLLHNDADGAVPWYQGIEMYLALRRLNKPVWMLNYNGEPHWPLKRENRIDFQKRMMQFFDHHLKGEPMPPWMTEGVPAIEKGIKKGY